MKNPEETLAGFVLGAFVVGIALTAVMQYFPEGSRPYIRGMIDCKRFPELCDRQFRIYTLEQEINKIRTIKSHDDSED